MDCWVSGGKFRHLGYMKANFKTSDDAVSYDEVYTKYRYHVSYTLYLYFLPSHMIRDLTNNITLLYFSR